MIRYCTYISCLGPIHVARTGAGVSDLSIATEADLFVKRLIRTHGVEPVYDEGAFAGLLRELDRYFNGEWVCFKEPLDLIGTPFELSVFNAMQRIPFGKTLSYHELAAAIGRPKAQRAVGLACGKNPVPVIVPCHRVVRSDGTIGGYTGGVWIKKALLALEGTTGIKGESLS
ncbi:MAG: methylated-DNA--[protein]-cysteine S-methyltransferase [Deltaproteobacteria bacterium]|nr:methylated-DNA--[protein]-cysteine S-methyltransferase [Deltaproteobacteria bacterium]